MNDDDLTRRIRRLEDRVAINELLVRYSIACDVRDFEALGDCFSDDGSFEAVAGKVEGREALVDYYRGRFKLYGPTVHIPEANTIDFDDEDDDRATGTVIARSEIMMDGAFLVSAHYYRDEYARCADGAWRLRTRDNEFIYGMPLSELPTHPWREPRRRWPGVDPVAADVPEGTQTWQAFEAEIDRR
ncbi:nuclear transport factor 2 family protein [Nocardioides sediminis]|uniref:nuclear transport factor 2 family protein n=1 Tax=Nocardioides sediminis TaxID=433648 RepID=UPI00131F0768|nr:nuclear transport factor 2 family protein [Nocardioides sediminis]